MGGGIQPSKLFGTDGVRGLANQYPMTAEAALRLAMAAGQVFKTQSPRANNRAHNRAHKIIIGKDTRRSGYMFENALTAGFTAAGMDVVLLGPMPTPAVGMLTRSMRADLGVMISASHNPAGDNGIKFFGPDGYKLSDAVEGEIETYFSDPPRLVPAHAWRCAKSSKQKSNQQKRRPKAPFDLSAVPAVTDAHLASHTPL